MRSRSTCDAEAAAESARRFLEQVPLANKTDRCSGERAPAPSGSGARRIPEAGRFRKCRSLPRPGDGIRSGQCRAADGVVAAARGQHEQRAQPSTSRSACSPAVVRATRPHATGRLARSLIGLNRIEAARDELGRACRVFEQVGAAWDAQGARTLLNIQTARIKRRSQSGTAAEGRSSSRARGTPAPGKCSVTPYRQTARSQRITVKRRRRQHPDQARLPTRAAAAAVRAREGWRSRGQTRGDFCAKLSARALPHSRPCLIALALLSHCGQILIPRRSAHHSASALSQISGPKSRRKANRFRASVRGINLGNGLDAPH